MSDDAKFQHSPPAKRVGLDDKAMMIKTGQPYPDVDAQQARKPGRLKGVIQMSADFDSTPEDIIEGFEGKL